MSLMKVMDFLFEIGFDKDEIREFYYVENDGFDGSGKPFYGNDVLYAKTYTDQTHHIELRDTGEIVEEYWDRGWTSGYYEFFRSNYESYKGNYYKAFPTRYRLWEFKFTKSLRRVLNKNKDLKTVIRPLRITPEKSVLYDTYNYIRHGKPPEKALLDKYEYMTNDDSKKMELCVFKDNKLIACSFFEAGMYALYSNTAFWDLNEQARSLGTLTILLEIKYALSRNMKHYYLGHFYAQNPNYLYKARFSGFELFDWETEGWVNFKNHRQQIKNMLIQKLPRHKD
jgi:arginyl-tRNA--protein-N-Asp/Glu arginylyltransferase